MFRPPKGQETELPVEQMLSRELHARLWASQQADKHELAAWCEGSCEELADFAKDAVEGEDDGLFGEKESGLYLGLCQDSFCTESKELGLDRFWIGTVADDEDGFYAAVFGQLDEELRDCACSC